MVRSLTTIRPLPVDRHPLVIAHVGHARRFALSLVRDRPWLADEAESLAQGVLVEAARDWEDRGHSFASFLYPCMRAAVCRLKRSYFVQTYGPSEDFACDDGPIGRLADTDDLLALVARLSCMSPDRRRILRLRYGLVDGREWTVRQVARDRGRRPDWVERTERAALAELRGLMEAGVTPARRCRGVRKVGAGWVAQIRLGGRTVHLGTFGDQAGAARAFEAAAGRRGEYGE